MTTGQRFESYLVENPSFPFCKGCGHNHVVKRLNDALTELQIDPSKILLVSDIGCIGLVDSLFPELHTMHTTHGRSTAFATGVEIADSILYDSQLKTIVVLGDGGAMIGLLHLVNAALMNADVTVILGNNFLFGMTGGQNSNFSPLEFVTPTTPRGNMVPPIDMCRVLEGCGAGFLARLPATDKELPHVIARAIAHPGFALVEVVELCTEYAVKSNELDGKSLATILERHRLETGILRQTAERPEFGIAYREKYRQLAEAPSNRDEIVTRYSSGLKKQIGIVIAGTAGEHVQLGAHLLARAAVMAGLECTQKNDNPVTQGSGFSLAEVCIGPSEILYTGIDEPDAIIVTSEDGAKELAANGTFERATQRTLVLTDTDINLPDTRARHIPYPLRKKVTPRRASIGGIYLALSLTGWIPPEAYGQAVTEKFGEGASHYARDFSVLHTDAEALRNLIVPA